MSDGSPPDGQYSIRVAARLTSIPADTLRMWERRYGFPKPARRPGGSRLYSDSDVALLRLLSRAVSEGYRPHELVGKSREELTKLLQVVDAKPTPLGAGAIPTLDSVLAALVADDPEAVRAEVRRASLALGARHFLTEFSHPLLVRVGKLWAEGKLAVRHEHLLSECLDTQLRVLLSAYEDRERRPVVVLATLPGEPHAMGLVMVALYLAVRGATPRLLGASTPVADISEAARALNADVVGLTITKASDLAKTARDVRALTHALPARTRLWLGGEGAAGVRGAGSVQVKTWGELDDALAAVVGTAR